jgi:ubiquinone/menaquinone biosynthesis C-methylase UbiE
MEILIPRREHVSQTEAADPVKWYYIPGTRLFYLHRFKMILRMFHVPHYPRLLDIGFGSGVFLPELSRRCDELHGIDIHPNIALVETMLHKEGLHATLTHASATDIPYPDNHFDCVVCASVLEHIADLSSAISEIKRVTKRDGTIVLGFPVENVLSHMILRVLYLWLPNAKLEDEHVNTHQAILEETRHQLQLVKSARFPAFVPLNYSLYYVCQCQV